SRCQGRGVRAAGGQLACPRPSHRRQGEAMRRGPKPAKSKEAKPPVARKSPKDDDARVRDLEKRLAEALQREAEALEKQTATSEILRVISRYPTNLQPVLDAIATTAAQLCGAYDAILVLREGNELRRVAHHGPIASAIREVRPITQADASCRAILDSGPVHVHAEVRPFTNAQVRLVETFADQAVIAIENVRLFRELEARTHDLTRSVGALRALREGGQAVSSTLS